MKSSYEEVSKEWEELANAAYSAAQILANDQEAVTRVYTQFRDQETTMLDRHGWSYEELRSEVLSRAGMSGNS